MSVNSLLKLYLYECTQLFYMIPECFRPFHLTLSENHSTVTLYDGLDLGSYASLQYIPTKPSSDFYTLEDVLANGQNLEGEHINLLAAIRKVGDHVISFSKKCWCRIGNLSLICSCTGSFSVKNYHHYFCLELLSHKTSRAGAQLGKNMSSAWVKNLGAEDLKYAALEHWAKIIHKCCWGS